MSQLLGLFGGTFDPVHLGHLNSLSLLDKTLQFDKVHWILSARPPHKNLTTASIEHRYAMLALALQDYDHYVPDDCEIIRTDKSYTYTTVQAFAERYPQASLCLIIGADSLQKLHTWYRYEELVDQVNLIVMHRPGYTMDSPDFLQNRRVYSTQQLSDKKAGGLLFFEQSDFDVSSTQIRTALSGATLSQSNQGLIQQFISKPVIDYIQQHRLYKKTV